MSKADSLRLHEPANSCTIAGALPPPGRPPYCATEKRKISVLRGRDRVCESSPDGVFPKISERPAIPL